MTVMTDELTNLLTDLEQAVRKCRIVYSKNVTERTENEIKSDEDYKRLKCELQATEASRADFKNEVKIRNETIAKQQHTIRLLRREVRRLKREIKSKDRAMFAQEESYKCMLDECNRREEEAKKKSIEQWFEKMLLETIKSLDNGTH